MVAEIKPGAQVADSAELGDGTVVWELAQVRENAHLGTGCIVGRGAYVGAGVRIGNNVKIQNYALVYEPAELADGVFVGPAVVLTNDQYPRSIHQDGSPKRAGDWRPAGVQIARGASLGARAVCVAPMRIGQWAMVAAGAVVIRDVPDYALVAGVPAKRIGWVGPAGRPLVRSADRWICPESGQGFEELQMPDGEPRLRPDSSDRKTVQDRSGA